MKKTRKEFLKQSASLAAFSTVGLNLDALQLKSDIDEMYQGGEWPILEGPDTPKIALSIDLNANQFKDYRRVKQLGVNNVYSYSQPEHPWKVEELKYYIDLFERNGLTLGHLHLGGNSYGDVVLGRQGGDKQIENIQKSIRAAGSAGLKLVEYNWTRVGRLMEGYYYKEGRGGAGYTAYDYSRVDKLPPKPGIGTHSRKELWERLTYFLEAVIPVAEEAGVRMAMHNPDPPAPRHHGSDQILVTFDDIKRMLNIVDSPYNGMICHPGYYEEIGEDSVEITRYLGERDRINHVHYRSVLVEEPVNKYMEVFPDNGHTDMFGVMRELIRQDYTGSIDPEHPRALDYDREHPEGVTSYSNVGGGGYAGEAYNVAYTRAMMQAALIVEGKS